jgi:hypothetical protein
VAQAVKLTGLDKFKGKLTRAKTKLPDVVWAATLEAVVFVEEQAKLILDEKVYDAPRKPFEPELTGELRDDSWYTDIYREGGTVFAELQNYHHAAWFLEGGTQEHKVFPVNAPKLVFIDPDEGYLRKEDQVEVSGVVATYFLSNAVNEHLPEIRAIFVKHFRTLWTT